MDDKMSVTDLYFNARQLLAATRSLRHRRDELRWTCEDLEDALLDLKLAYIGSDTPLADDFAQECIEFMEQISSLVGQLPDEEPDAF